MLQEGDRVVYSKFAGTDVQVAGEEHILLKVSTKGPKSEAPARASSTKAECPCMVPSIISRNAAHIYTAGFCYPELQQC